MEGTLQKLGEAGAAWGREGGGHQAATVACQISGVLGGTGGVERVHVFGSLRLSGTDDSALVLQGDSVLEIKCC